MAASRSLAEIVTDLTAARATRTNILLGQDVSRGDKRIVFPSLKEINKLIKDLELEYAMRSTAGGMSTKARMDDAQ